MKVRDGIYFVDFVTAQAPPTSVSLVLDLGKRHRDRPRGDAARLSGRGPVTGGPHRRRTGIDGRVRRVLERSGRHPVHSRRRRRHQPTTDLIGRRVEYTYSSTEQYEHIYLNEDFYTWHCLQGSEKGLADTDRCHYLKLGDDLYLFVWREKIVPTLGAVVADFRAMRTMGKIFGHAQDGSRGVVDFPVGARARLLNVTSRGEGDSALSRSFSLVVIWTPRMAPSLGRDRRPGEYLRQVLGEE